MAIYSGFTHWKWWFSIVTLIYQRVVASKFPGADGADVDLKVTWLTWLCAADLTAQPVRTTRQRSRAATVNAGICWTNRSWIVPVLMICMMCMMYWGCFCKALGVQSAEGSEWSQWSQPLAIIAAISGCIAGPKQSAQSAQSAPSYACGGGSVFHEAFDACNAARCIWFLSNKRTYNIV